MAYKNKEMQKIKAHEYYMAHKQEIFAKNREWYAKNSVKVLARSKELRTLDPERFRKTQKRSKRSLRLEVLSAYGHKCNCCGENREPFLTIEHIGGWGESHRKSVTGVYRDIRKMGFPRDKFTILCWNCNCSTSRGRICPHKAEVQCVSA